MKPQDNHKPASASEPQMTTFQSVKAQIKEDTAEDLAQTAHNFKVL